MKIAVGVCWGQDPSIFRLLDSIPKSWKVFVIDGRFTNSNFKNEYSSKELRNQLNMYPNVEIHKRAGMEYYVRDLYFELMEGYDYGLVIDSDEYIIYFDEKIFLENIKTLDSLHLLEYQNTIHYGRFFVKPSRWRHYKSHKFVRRSGVVQSISQAQKVVKGLILAHDENLRSKPLQDIINAYQKQLWKYENENNINTLASVVKH